MNVPLEEAETTRLRLHVPSTSPFLIPFKMGSMQPYGAVYT